jgi:hypothetical protein
MMVGFELSIGIDFSTPALHQSNNQLAKSLA